MKIATPNQMNEIDKKTITRFGIPSIVLMENAGLKVFHEIKKTFHILSQKKIIILAGKGNNGGDAFVVARHLFNNGVDVEVYLFCKKNQIKNDALINFAILEKMGVKIIELIHESQLITFKLFLFRTDLIIDGIFGTGIRGEITGLTKDVIELVNQSDIPIYSIDIPSGVNGTTGKILGISVKAQKTITFGMPKLGQFIYPGCEYVGELITADIGIPSKVFDCFDIKNNIIDETIIKKLLPKRKTDSSKGDFGKLFIITGSKGMTGAGCLASNAALRAGSGLIYLGIPKSLDQIYSSTCIESITIPLEDKNGYLAKESIYEINTQMGLVDVIAIGPGLSQNEEIYHTVSNIISNCSLPIVLDADALNVISKDINLLKNIKSNVVITPHPGEMARLCNVSVADVQNNRIEVAREFSLKFKITTVLKGAKTIIATPDGTIYINPTGNSGMASAGMGDVLTGIIASFIGQGLSPEEAAILGTYVHGMAGDNLAREKGEYGLIASDLINEIPYVLKNL